MDYEKAYNEMVQRARELHEAGNDITKRQMEIVFPELAESEDDRIRKAILGLTYLDGIEPILTKCSITRCEIRAYLEKQKAKEQLDRMAPIYNDKESFESALEKAWKYYNESSSRTVDSFDDDYIECVFSKGFREGFLYKEKQKDASKAIEAVERIDKYIDEHTANAHDMKDSNPDKKYYRGWDDALGKMSGILQDVYSGEKQKEQKSRKFKLGDKVRWQDDGKDVITITGFRNDAYLTDSAYGPILFSDENNWERIEEKSLLPEDKVKHPLYVEGFEAGKEVVTHQMEDEQTIDDYVRKGLDEVCLRYAELGAKWGTEHLKTK